MTIKRSAILIVLVVSLASCSNRQNGEVSVKEDLTAKQLLQGIWVNDETEMPLMRIEGAETQRKENDPAADRDKEP